MCLGVPMRIKSVNGETAVAEINGIEREVRLDLVDNIKPGDYVIVHAGFAIQTLDEQEALETLEMIAEAFGDEENLG